MNIFDTTYFNTWTVNLATVEGCFKPFRLDNVEHDETIENAHKRINPVEVLDTNQNLHKILLGATPSKFYHEIDENLQDENTPIILSKPLIKVESSENTLKGFRSGARSAILYSETDKTYYRLKGCGNYVDQEKLRFKYPGFPLREMNVFGEVIGEELRGCALTSYSLRELAITQQINDKLAARTLSNSQFEPIKLGNQSVGHWKYPNLSELQTHPEIQQTCTIFKTFGERRLASHLLRGLDLLLKFGCVAFDVEEVKNQLQNREGKGKPYPLTTYAACSAGQNRASPINFVDNKNVKTDVQVLEKLAETNLFEDTSLQSAWKQALLTVINAQLKHPDQSLFSILNWRLGYEIGEFLSILQEEDIMWGYYYDYNPCEPHCNSHPNNFIVLPPSESTDGKCARFLAAVDFDMAFTRESFFDLQTGNPDDSLFDEWKKDEIAEMQRSIGGDLFSNDGIAIAQVNKSFIDAIPCISVSDIEVVTNAMRDTMLSGCHTGMKKNGSLSWSYSLDDGLHAIVSLCLLLSKDIQS